MSTKTTFKRVALVAVAAMGFGLLTVAPSSAAQQADTLALSALTTANSTGTIGTAVSTTLTQTFFGNNGDTMSVMAAIVSYPTGFAVSPTITAVNSGQGGTNAPVGTDRMQLTDTATVSGVATGTTTVSFTPTGSGTYVFSFTPYRGNSVNQAAGTAAVATTAAVVTWTVTVGASATAVGDSSSTAVLNAAGVTSGSTADTAVTLAAGSSLAAVATITVTPLASAVATTGSTLISATISGPGTLSASASATPGATTSLKSATYSGLVAGKGYVHVYGDGTSGTSIITISIGTLVIAAKTVTFSGAAASAVSTVVTPVIATGSGAVATSAVTAIVKDAGGNVVSGKLLYAVSGTATVFASTSATSDSTGQATFSLTGLAAGTSTVTVQDVAAGSTATFSAAAVSVRVGSNVAASATMSLDKATYLPGEAATLTLVIKDAAGNTVPDGSYSPFTSTGVTSSRALSAGTVPTTASVTTGSSTGRLTYSVNVPNTSGAFTVSASAGSGWTGTYSVTATVSPSAQETANADAIAASTDAASEATDAANAATDAANAAAEAADAATAAAQDAADAVTALATQVADLIAGLTAQISAQKAAITALTNLVIKIQKKVKA